MDVLGRAVLESSRGEELTTVGGPNIFNVLCPWLVMMTLLCLPLYCTSTSGLSRV
jgi:hypothetical protein